MKVVHAADIHLDSPLRGLERYEGAPLERARGATRRALENLVGLCLEERAELLLLAGDLFDGDWKDYSTGLFFAAQMTRLREAGVEVALVRGNHDALSQMARQLRLPDNVHQFSEGRPETRIYERMGVAVHGQSFATRAVRDDLARGYPDAIPGLLNLGLLHTSVTGREGHEDYAPCTLETLLGKRYDYWALGHVHRMEVLHERPWVAFSGNLQGRHVRETGAKGALLIEARDGRIERVESRALDVARWLHLELDAGDALEPEDVLERARDALTQALVEAEGRLLLARVCVTGRSDLIATLRVHEGRWEAELRALANDVGADRLWLERVRFVGGAAGLGARESHDALSDLLGSVRGLPHDAERLARLVEELEPLRRKLLRVGVALDEAGTPEGVVLDALDDVEQLLGFHLLAGDERA